MPPRGSACCGGNARAGGEAGRSEVVGTSTGARRRTPRATSSWASAGRCGAGRVQDAPGRLLACAPHGVRGACVGRQPGQRGPGSAADAAADRRRSQQPASVQVAAAVAAKACEVHLTLPPHTCRCRAAQARCTRAALCCHAALADWADGCLGPAETCASARRVAVPCGSGAAAA